MPYKDKEKYKQYQREYKKKHADKWKDYMKEYHVENNEKIKHQARLRHVQQKYGLTADEYLQMVLDQNNRCAICTREETYRNRHGDIRPLSVDHCHTTGKVRGLLCTQCNSMLGHARDDKETLQRAIDYLGA